MVRLLSCLLVLLVLSSCTGGGAGNPNNSGAAAPADKGTNFKETSASDIRRGLAQASPDKKDATLFATDTSNSVNYFCDRKTLPRTCCYYALNGGGTFYGGSPSCVEENH